MSVDFLSNIVDRMEQTRIDLDSITATKGRLENVIKIDPKDISNWEFRDRQEFELGDIDALAKSIITKGQAQPIIVVESNNVFHSSDNSQTKYIVIAGYRRWLACKEKKISVDAIVRILSFDQAIDCLVSENEKEKVSDYSKGMFYYNLLKKEGVTKKTLYERLGINRSVFDNYLSFSEVPKDVWEAVKFLNNVSARTSATIKSICQKGEAEKNAILVIADKIASGIGEKKITALVAKILCDNNKSNHARNATRVAFSENVFIEMKKDSLIVSVKKIKDSELNELKEKLSGILEIFCEKNK